MVIKWKNKLMIFVIAFFLVFGSLVFLTSLRGLVTYDREIEHEGNIPEYIKTIYLADYLKKFDDNTLKTRSISDEEVNNYRYKYGDLQAQVQDISQQYQDSLRLAEADQDTTSLKKLNVERDEKLLAIVTNFTDEETVKEKIVQEETKRIKKDKAKILPTYEREKEKFEHNYYYYLKDNTGKIYKNVSWLTSKMTNVAIEKKLNSEGVGKVVALADIDVTPQSLVGLSGEIDEGISVTGYVTRIKDSAAAKDYYFAREYKRQLERKMVFSIVFLIIGMGLFFLFLRQEIAYQRLARLLNGVPLDVRIILLGVLVVVALTLISSNQTNLFGSKALLLLGGGIYVVTLVILGLLKDLWLSLRGREQYPSLLEQVQGTLIRSLSRKISQSSPYFKASLCLTLLIAMTGIAMVAGFTYRWVSFWGLLLIVIAIGLLIAYQFVKREVKIQEILSQPADILNRNEEEFQEGYELNDVQENLGKIDRIVSATRANKQRNEELKTELLTNVSHDLRTPLTSIITYGDLLTKKQLTEPARQEYTTIINKKAMRMKNLIDDLFEVTKMNNGEIVLNKKMINLGQLIQQSIAEYGDEFAEKDLKMLYTKPSESLLMVIDGDRMWRVFDNIISNVVKYSLEGTRVYLKLEQQGSDAVIQLKNISQYELHEDAENLVERFTRGDEARNTEGSGLGLAIANSIVDLHDGRLEIAVDGDMFKIMIVLPLTE